MQLFEALLYSIDAVGWPEWQSCPAMVLAYALKCHALSCWVPKLCGDVLVHGEVPVLLVVLGGGLIPSVHSHHS